MILVDIYVPSTGQDYDFQLDQYASIASVVEELSELIAQKERCSLSGKAADLCLCSREQQCILPDNLTLDDCGIRTGSRLILV